MALHDLPRLIRTVRHLRPSQIYWRGRYTVQRRARRAWGARSGPAVSSNGSVPRLRDDFPADVVRFDDTSPDPTLLAQLSAGEFRASEQSPSARPPSRLAVGKDRSRSAVDGDTALPQLGIRAARLAVRTDPTAEEAGHLFMEYVSDWMQCCDLAAAGAAELAWNAYATATRIGWWIRSAVLLGPEWWSNRGDFHRSFLSSLWCQAAYLARNIEWDLRGNHLVRDAVGLAFAGRFFDGAHAKKWLSTAMDLAQSQLVEQVLDDGGHFERSPHYHLKVMEDFFVLSKLIEDENVRRELAGRALRMAEFLRWVRHPDGDIPLLNDAALKRRRAARGDLSPPRRKRSPARHVVARWRKPFCPDGTGGLAWHALERLF